MPWVIRSDHLMDASLLCLNSGSSSLKFALYSRAAPNSARLIGEAENIGLSQGSLRIRNEKEIVYQQPHALDSHETALRESLRALHDLGIATPAACVHRVVHGGDRFARPTWITDRVRAALEKLTDLAPLHLPDELSVIEATARFFPKVPQIACFDTAFHERMPELAKGLPLPRNLRERGIRRYGFHGLSYEFVVARLGPELGHRCIIAHLGSGCSLVALKDLVPQDTTMGLTPTGGLMMGTRSGDLDPGVFFYLLRRRLREAAPSSPEDSQETSKVIPPDPIREVERLLNDRSGLRGVSALSSSMKELLRAESDHPAAREAIDLFCYTVRKFIGSLSAVLGGLDTLVFTGGMGHASPAIRGRICEGLEYLDVRIDPERNQSQAATINPPDSRCVVRQLLTDENQVMARHAMRLLAQASGGLSGRRTQAPSLRLSRH